MAKHKGDMLEALRATLRNAREEEAQAREQAREQAQQTEHSARAEAKTPASEQPAQAGESVGRPAPVSEPATRRPLQQELAELDRRIAAARSEKPHKAQLVVQGLAIVVAFLVGRWTASTTVQAEGPPGASQRESLAADVEAAAEAASSSRQSRADVLGALPSTSLLEAGSDPDRDDAIFQDRSNTHSVMAITYEDNESNLRRAFAVYDDLRERGMPAVTPMRSGAYLIVFVGAAPGSQELDALVSRLRRTPGPTGMGSAPYSTASIVPIDRYR